MNRTMLLAATAAVALAWSGAAEARHPAASVTGTKAKRFAHPPVNRALDVLWDQNGTDNGIGIVSQNFESSFDAYDAQAADDFTVPAVTRWVLREVDVTGAYFNGSGPAASVNVTIYRHNKGKPANRGYPGTVRAQFLNVAAQDDGNGSFVITLPHKVRLRSGTHWLSVQVNLDFLAGGEWGWENQTTTAGNPAQWRNPNGGFGVCSKWAQENVCIPDGQGDHIFTLRGESQSQT